MQNKSIKPEPEYFKCPECGHRTELEYSGAISITKCERCRLFGNRNLWDKWADSERICLEWRKAYDCLETELERTRKALEMTDTDLAIIVTNLDKVFPDMRLVFETIRSARKRIAEITAPEQKDQ